MCSLINSEKYTNSDCHLKEDIKPFHHPGEVLCLYPSERKAVLWFPLSWISFGFCRYYKKNLTFHYLSGVCVCVVNPSYSRILVCGFCYSLKFIFNSQIKICCCLADMHKVTKNLSHLIFTFLVESKQGDTLLLVSALIL